MEIILAIIQFSLIGYICIDEVLRKSSVALMWATLMIMFGIMHVFSVFTGSSQYSMATLNKASLFVSGFCIIYIFTRKIFLSLSRGTRETFKIENIRDSELESTTFPFVVFCVSASLIAYLLVRFSGGLLGTSWSMGRDYSASLGYANSSQVLYILYFSLSGLSIYTFIKKERLRTIICLSIMAVAAVITRNRILIIPFLIVWIAYAIFSIKHIKIKHLALAIVAAVAVIYLVYGLRVFRHYGAISVFLNNFDWDDFIGRINLYIKTDNGELGLRNSFYHFIEHNNNFQGFGTGASYIRMLLVYIPSRYSFGLKPDDFAITMGSAMGMAAGGSEHPTLFGDCFANLGWAGMLLGVFWALYASLADKITLKFHSTIYRVMAYSLFASMYVIMGRGSVYNSFFYVAWGIPLLVLLSYIHRNSKKVKIVFGSHERN